MMNKYSTQRTNLVKLIKHKNILLRDAKDSSLKFGVRILINMFFFHSVKKVKNKKMTSFIDKLIP